MFTAALMGLGSLAAHVSLRRTLKRTEELPPNASLPADKLPSRDAAQLIPINVLSRPAKIKPALLWTARPPSPVFLDGVSPEMLSAISQRLSDFFGQPVPILSARKLRSREQPVSPWTLQGRASAQVLRPLAHH